MLRLSMYISVREKKFDKIPLWSIIALMDETYYARNKEARCKYQREYYKKNKDRINRKRQIDEAVDPEKIEKRLAYNRAYYLKNRERLLKRRAERRRVTVGACLCKTQNEKFSNIGMTCII